VVMLNVFEGLARQLFCIVSLCVGWGAW